MKILSISLLLCLAGCAPLAKVAGFAGDGLYSLLTVTKEFLTVANDALPPEVAATPTGALITIALPVILNILGSMVGEDDG